MDPLKSPPGDPAHDFSRGAAVSKYTRADPERSVESDIREKDSGLDYLLLDVGWY